MLPRLLYHRPLSAIFQLYFRITRLDRVIRSCWCFQRWSALLDGSWLLYNTILSRRSLERSNEMSGVDLIQQPNLPQKQGNSIYSLEVSFAEKEDSSELLDDDAEARHISDRDCVHLHILDTLERQFRACWHLFLTIQLIRQCSPCLGTNPNDVQ